MGSKTWTQDEIDFLAKNYGRIPIEELSAKLGRSVYAIKHQTQRQKIKSSNYWTEREVRILLRLHGHATYKAIGEAIGRTEKAVRDKSNSMNLGDPKYASDELCMRQVSEMLGVPPKRVQRMVQSGELKARKKSCYRMIKPEDLFDWMKNHPEKWSVFDITESWYFEGESWFKEKAELEINARYMNV